MVLPSNGSLSLDRCAMKVGTDGILLGARAIASEACAGYWRGQRLAGADARAAYRDDVHVEAVELDEEAAAQARETPSRRRGLRGLRSGRPIFISGSRRKLDAMN